MEKLEYRLMQIKNGKRQTIGEVLQSTEGKWQAKTKNGQWRYDLTHDQAIDYIADYWTGEDFKTNRKWLR